LGWDLFPAFLCAQMKALSAWKFLPAVDRWNFLPELGINNKYVTKILGFHSFPFFPKREGRPQQFPFICKNLSAGRLRLENPSRNGNHFQKPHEIPALPVNDNFPEYGSPSRPLLEKKPSPPQTPYIRQSRKNFYLTDPLHHGIIIL